MNDLKVLLIEDEPGIVRMLEPILKLGGAHTKVAWSGSQGLEYIGADPFDLILCDLGLPDLNGKDLIPRIRQITDTPIIVLSASGLEDDRVVALDSGADDFVPKPFSGPELLARIRAVLRRRLPQQRRATLKIGCVEIDFQRRRAMIEDVEVRLSAREHALLTLLASREGGVVTHQDIIEHVWGPGARAETQSVRVLVGQLRQKMEADPSSPTLICTEPGVGYRFGNADTVPSST